MHYINGKIIPILKINPQHTVPTIVDNGFTMWESRAVMIYLQDKYGKDESLYPKDPQKRAVILQRLMFDESKLDAPITDHARTLIRKQTVTDEQKKKVEDSFEFLNTFLNGSSYVAGNNLTLADISIFANVSTAAELGYSLEKYSNLAKWYERVKTTIPGHELNTAGIQWIKDFFANKP